MKYWRWERPGNEATVLAHCKQRWERPGNEATVLAHCKQRWEWPGNEATVFAYCKQRWEWPGNKANSDRYITCNTGLELLRSSTNLGTHPVSITSDMGGLCPGRTKST